jgi:hypothetical protein
MYSREHKKQPNSSNNSPAPAVSKFAAPRSFVQPQIEDSSNINSDQQNQDTNQKAQPPASNWPDVSMFTYRPQPVKPQIQLKRNVDKLGKRQSEQADPNLIQRSETPSYQSTTSLQRKEQPKVSNLASSSQVIQRYGDKMAVNYEDLQQKEIQKKEEIIELQTGIQNIYNKHKENKKQARDKLDQEYQTASENLEQKQEYMEAALQYKIYTELTGKDNLKDGKTIDFTNKITKAQTKKAEIKDINVTIKAQIDQQANDLSTTIIQKIISLMQERVKNKKTTNKPAWISKVDEYTRDYSRHAIADPIVQNYEKGYKASGLNKAKIQQEWLDYCKSKDHTLSLNEIEENVVQVFVKPDNNQEVAPIQIATVYFEEKRFVKSAEIKLNEGTGQEEIREVFKHRESGKEYVQDAFNAYVKRYVKRALNKYDNPGADEGVSIKSDPRQKKGTSQPWSQIAAAIPNQPQEQMYQEIRNHQRSKELQGGSPFISFTTTDRPIFGSSAKPFEGEHGVATVDLAKISKNRVFDTHTPKAIKQIHNVDDPNPDMPFVENNEEVERNSAARDAMRTRELVVAGDIPLDAITGVKAQGANYIKGPSGKFQPPQAALKAHIQKLLSSKSSGPKIDDID